MEEADIASIVASSSTLREDLRVAYDESGFKLIYLFAPPVSIAASASMGRAAALASSLPEGVSLPGLKVDTKTTYVSLLSSFDRSSLVTCAFMGTHVRVVRHLREELGDQVSPTLRELAISSGEWSRFRTDGSVPRNVFEAMFEAWITNSINRSLADEVFIAQDLITNKDVGFITVKRHGTVVNIGLLAVAQTHRRMGIASMLLSRATLWAMEHTGFISNASLSVVTQGSNDAACCTYEKFGMNVSIVQEVQHVWLPQHLIEPNSRTDQAPIPFCKQYFTGQEKEYVSQLFSSSLDSASRFTLMCSTRLQALFGEGSDRVVMVPSGTAALEMAALLCELQPGDEVIMPSYTFASTANAFVLRGAVPVFVDIRPDTLNIDERLVEQAITSKTRVICVVHYGGTPCEMDTICEIASRHKLLVVEDAAQGKSNFFICFVVLNINRSIFIFLYSFFVYLQRTTSRKHRGFWVFLFPLYQEHYLRRGWCYLHQSVKDARTTRIGAMGERNKPVRANTPRSVKLIVISYRIFLFLDMILWLARLTATSGLIWALLMCPARHHARSCGRSSSSVKASPEPAWETSRPMRWGCEGCMNGA